ncbi:MAG: metal dependent phosphohydrolase [Rhodospirillaceae bacterium]|nr:MAG: metal dependent phosphohydrolase [Rhodospirillaceae bacterium]
MPDIDKSLLKSLLGLASVVELRDPYTGGHLWRVGQFSKLLAERVGMDAKGIFLAAIGGFLHDLGKIGVPDAILRKPDRLTEQEFAVIRSHPTMGAELLHDHPLAPLVLDAVLHHHERPDGTGYPDGLDGERTTLVAHIVAIADAFDAMTSTRSYRRGMPAEKALTILLEEKGRQFNAVLVDEFVSLHRLDGRLEHVVGHSDHGQPLVDCPNCGPIIVVPRTRGDGDDVFCRNCGGLARLHRKEDGFEAVPLDAVADPGMMRPSPEVDVLDQFIDTVPPARSSFFLGRISTMVTGRGGER